MRIKSFILICLLLSCGSEPEIGLEDKRPSPSGTEGDGLLSLLPQDGEIDGWILDGDPRFFDAGDLWEFINGAAEGYLAYGFEEVVTADYIQQGGDQTEGSDQAAVIDIYRMKDPINAYGIYSQERNANYDFMDIGVEGYLGGTALNFWRGPYYVKITVFDDKEELKAKMIEMGNHIAGKINDPATEPAEVAYFPTEHQMPYSVIYLPKDVLGQSYLVNAFESRYQDGDQEYKIILASMDDSETATEVMARYRQFQGGGEDLEGIGDGGFVGEDSFYGKVLAVQSGNRLLIALGAPSETAGKDLISQTLAKIETQ